MHVAAASPPVRPPRAAPPRRSGVIVAVLLLLLGGVAYRAAVAVFGSEALEKIALPTPLSALPLTLGEWQGVEVPVSEGVQRVAGNDDFLSRTYRRALTGQSVSVYVGYTARPRTMLQHRPTVCYPSAGFSHLYTRNVSLDESHGLVGMVHSFLKSDLVETRAIVLNYYVLAGAYTIDEKSFWSVAWRTPNLSGDFGRYVAQVQVMAPIVTSEEAAVEAVKSFALDSAAELRRLLPGTPEFTAAAAGSAASTLESGAAASAEGVH
ncbi:MAG: EpsI family protein [Phycisphaerales bacterium]|nr:EpsI family protein [Phycisphaerales bacterium]